MSPSAEEYEGANAREWDDSPQKPRPMTAMGKFLGGGPLAAPSVPSSAPAEALGRIAVSMSGSPQHSRSGLQSTTSSPPADPAGQGHQVSQRPGELWQEEMPGKVRLSKQWPKLCLTTTAKQREKVKEDRKITEENQFMKQCPSYDFSATSYYLWPLKYMRPDQVLGGDTMNDLNDIRKNCQVFMDFDVDSECIKVHSNSFECNDEALHQLKLAIRGGRAQFEGKSALKLVVEPPFGSAMKARVSPQFKHVQDSSQQPSVTEVRLCGPEFTAEESSTWEQKRSKMMEKNRAILSQSLCDAFCKLSGLRGGLRMRVHLGHVEFTRYPAKFSTETYSVQSFIDMVSNSGTAAHLEKSIRDFDLASKIKAHMGRLPHLFSPADSVTCNVAEVKSKHSLVILAFTPSKDRLRIEADFDQVCGFNRNDWQIGPTVCYKQSGHKTRLNIGTVCFGSGFDWSIEIITNEILSDVPKELILGLGCCDPVERKDELGLSFPFVTPQFHRQTTVQQMWIRSVNEYLVTDTPYTLESTIYRKWDGGDTTVDPSIVYGLTLYNKDWDILMGPGEKTWDSDPELNAVFPGLNFEDGFSSFLNHVRNVQDFLNGV